MSGDFLIKKKNINFGKFLLWLSKMMKTLENIFRQNYIFFFKKFKKLIFC